MIRASSIPAERAAGKLIAAPATVSEKPILFSAPMILAILAGTKTVTRRIVKGPIEFLGSKGESDNLDAWGWAFDGKQGHGYEVLGRGHRWRQNHDLQSIRCPYGEVGDRLRVRETWQTWTRQSDSCAGIRFRADESFMPIENTREAADLWIETHDNGAHGADWRPSIFMPRWASRIYLEVTDVKVERLQDITEEQAKAEGVTTDPVQGKMNGKPATLYPMTHRQAFIWLWSAINEKRAPWASNPFVWCVSFRRIKP